MCLQVVAYAHPLGCQLVTPQVQVHHVGGAEWDKQGGCQQEHSLVTDVVLIEQKDGSLQPRCQEGLGNRMHVEVHKPTVPEVQEQVRQRAEVAQPVQDLYPLVVQTVLIESQVQLSEGRPQLRLLQQRPEETLVRQQMAPQVALCEAQRCGAAARLRRRVTVQTPQTSIALHHRKDHIWLVFPAPCAVRMWGARKTAARPPRVAVQQNKQRGSADPRSTVRQQGRR